MIVALMTTSGIYPSGVNAIMMIMAVNKPVRTSSLVFVLRIAFSSFLVRASMGLLLSLQVQNCMVAGFSFE